MTPPTSSARTRLWSARAISPSRTSQPISLGRPADGLGRFQVAAADEHGEPREKAPLALVEQVVAPGDGAAQRLLALGQVARAGRQDAELVLESLEDRVGLKQLDAGRRELDRQRHPVEPGADPGDGRGVLVRDREVRPDGEGAGDEQPDRLVLRDPGGREVALARWAG